MFRKALNDFLQLESSSGILIILAALLAMGVENSPFSEVYHTALNTIGEVRIGDYSLSKPVLLWINDGLMAMFFFLIGMEIKREVVDGELADPQQIILPAIAAVGGMAVPAVVYYLINSNDPVALNGWAIPAATDIAFALGVLSLLGNRVPMSLKIFLMTLAIIDDLGAIIVIALFYSSGLSMLSLVTAAVLILLLYIMNRKGVDRVGPYLLIGTLLWIAVLKSGVHATLAGVVLAQFIPMKDREGGSPLKRLEHDLHPAVAFIILPVFAFANTGVPLAGFTMAALTAPIPLGILAGLTIGKQIGVFGFAVIALKCGVGRLPKGMNWSALYGVSALCGIGFTMSLFVSSLAFEQVTVQAGVDERIGILVGSVLSAIIGYIVLARVFPEKRY
ncbi:MAG: Na+/H+ antiporter NhaA [Desulfovibrio sp.]